MIGNRWVTADPFVGGSLEDAFCGLISWCIEHVRLASAKIK
jgi:hypothetical protein